MNSYLRVDSLTLIGSRKNYNVNFDDGINIIHGDSDTGKSSILEFINYFLGSSSIELADEVISSVTTVYLEVTINDQSYTIYRDIFKPTSLIEVYNCILSEINHNIPKKYAPRFNIKNAPDGFYSDFLMDSLNFPKLKLKVSPTQDVSKFRRLSFRDIMKFCYIDQDDMGSKSLLGLKDWVKYTHVKEVFKYIFNVFDADIADIGAQISEKTAQLNKIVRKYENVSEFLRDTGYKSINSLDDEINDCDILIEELEDRLARINNSMTSDSELYNQLKAYHVEFNLKSKSIIKIINDLSHKRDQYIRLRNDYSNDIKKIQAIHSTNNAIIPSSQISCNCPICDSTITLDKESSGFISTSSEKLDEELSSLKKRINSIEDLISEISMKEVDLKKEKSIIDNDLKEVSQMIDTEAKSMVAPFLTQRDALVQKLSNTKSKRDNLVSSLRVRNHQEDILNQQVVLKDNLKKLNDELERLKAETPSIDGVLSNLADNLNDFLTKINIKNRTGISISANTFSAVVRGRDYFNITSGGLRTLVTIGYISSILKLSAKSSINHPRFLLLDTVGKYLGKSTKPSYLEETDAIEDEKEGTSDPEKYEEIFNWLIDITNKAQKTKTPCQIIIVDNDVPEKLAERLKALTVAQFSSSGDGNLSPGLIDDISYM